MINMYSSNVLWYEFVCASKVLALEESVGHSNSLNCSYLCNVSGSFTPEEEGVTGGSADLDTSGSTL